MFAWGITCTSTSNSRMFHSYADVTPLPVKCCKFGAAYCHEHWGFFTLQHILWHTFVMIISEDSWHSHLLQKVWQWSCRYLVLRLSLSRPVIEPRPPAYEANTLPTEPPRRLRISLIFIYLHVNISKFCYPFSVKFHFKNTDKFL